MSDFDINKFKDNNDNEMNLLSDLEALTKKYGLSFDTEYKTETDTPKAYSSLKDSNSVKMPDFYYEMYNPSSSVKTVRSEERNAYAGPEGRKVIYAENESVSVAEKRLRNAINNGYHAQVANRQVSAIRKPENNFSAPLSAKERGIVQISDTTQKSDDTTVTAAEEKESTENIQKKPHKHYETSEKNKTSAFFRSFLPWKGDPAKEIIRKTIMNISAIVVLICFGYFVDNYIQHQNMLQHQEELKDNHIEAETINDLEIQWNAIKEKYPTVEFPDGMNIKWAELYAKNQDLIGWLTIDNTNIDSPVMHKPSDRDNGDAQDFYLKRNFYKNDDKYGTPYLNKNNAGATLDLNNTIYGHNMMDGLSFAQLEKYYTIEGFKESPIIKYSTLYEDYYFKVYAAFITNGYPSGDNGYLFNYNMAHFPSAENFEKFIQAIDERKLYDTGVDITKEDKLITLSTCSYEIKKTDMGRLAVIGRLVRPGEDISVDTSKAVANENIRYPQVWYDEHNMANPYIDAYQWIPE